LDFENRIIRCTKSYNTRARSVKSTKAGYWRNVPISGELQQLLHELKLAAGGREHVLPRYWQWDRGEQARILRMFCLGIGIPSIRFHALRACFATQLMSHSVAPIRVMKICGWRDLKTMERYVRLAGVDERGATDCLQVLSSDAEAMGKVVSLFPQQSA
jgi:integrase